MTRVRLRCNVKCTKPTYLVAHLSTQIALPATPDAARTGTKKYILMAPWPVMAGTGVNNVILGMREAIIPHYEPEIVSTDWSSASGGQIRCKLYTPTLPLKNFVAFLLFFIPTLVRLYRLTKRTVAVNPHFVGLQYLPLCVLRR